MGDDDLPRSHSEAQHRAWMRDLPVCHVEDQVIFMHAGIGEEAGDLWRWGTDEETMIWKFPAQVGRFMDGWSIVAGHVSTAKVRGSPAFHGVFYDGASHYYIDGDVLVSGTIPILLADTEAGTFYEIKRDGEQPVSPYGRIAEV